MIRQEDNISSNKSLKDFLSFTRQFLNQDTNHLIETQFKTESTNKSIIEKDCFSLVQQYVNYFMTNSEMIL